MKIGIDARFYGTLGKGLGRYTQKLIENLEKIDCENQYYIFLRKENFQEYFPANENFHKVLADFRWYSFSEQILFPMLLLKYNLDLVHFPHFNVPVLYPKKFIITIHDLILLHFPTLRNTTLNLVWYRIKFLAYRLSIYCAIKRSFEILTVSEFTKKDILSHYSVPKEKIFVTYEACEDFCHLPEGCDDNILKKYGIIKPYFLYVGNAYPHKNLERMIQAFGSLKGGNSKFQLVLVGKHDYFYLRLKRFIAQEKIQNVLLVGYVPDSDLDTLYKKSLMYIFPSLYEGFGLPPLEAMSKGTPVLCSDHSCMIEILGKAAYFMNASDTDEIKKGMLHLIENQDVRNDLVSEGYKQSKKYSWKQMAEESLFEYQKIKKN